MTLIAYKDGVICADSQRQQSGRAAPYPCLKIARRADGWLFACAGYAATSQHWMTWFLEGCSGAPPWRDMTRDNADDILLFRPDGSADLYVSDVALAENVRDERFATGNVGYLNGLMDAGLGAADAIKAAIRCGYTCADYPLIELRHAGPPVIWTSEREQGDTAEFFAACGVAPGEFIQDVAPIALAAE